MNPKVSWALPLASAAGVKVSLPSSMSARVIAWSSITSAPSSSRRPSRSSAVILTLASVSGTPNRTRSMSEKLKSAAVNVYAVSSAVVTVLSAAVGASFTGFTWMRW